MDLRLLTNFIADAKQACMDCNAAYSLPGPEPEIVRLQHAARSATIDRQGRVATGAGRAYEYRVHGSGYSFGEILSGKEIHFDVAPVCGVPRIRFSASGISRYLESVGARTSPDVVRSELNRLGDESPELMHITDNGFDYYLWSAD